MDAAARNRLGAGRVLAMRKFPYYSRILSVMVVCERPGLGKFTADARWRLYYDPEKVMAWTLEEVAAAWIHCVEHIFRQHAQRFNSLEDPRKDPELFQQCADVAINEDLKQNGWMMPELENQHYFDTDQHPEWSKGMGAEEMYFATKGTSGRGTGDTDTPQGGSGNQEPPEPQRGDESPAEDQQDPQDRESKAGDDRQDRDEQEQSGQDKDPEQEDGQAQNQGEPSVAESSPESQDEASEAASSEKNSGDSPDSDNGDSEVDDDTRADGESKTSSGDTDEEDESGDSQGGSGDSTDDDDSDSASDGDSDGDSESDGDGQGEETGQMDCGSSVDNIRRDYEERSNDDGSVNSVAAENIKKDTAKDIINFANSRPGSVPNSLVREATRIIKPQVDWRKDLMMEIRRGISKKAGQADRSYKKAARRSLHPKMIMPGKVAPPVPTIAIILDTSGSMDEAVELSIALSEIDNLLKSMAKESEAQALTIINCDAGANTPVVVRKLTDYEMVGGGGTDMRVGIHRAAEMKPMFDIIMTITDGYTPWPRETPKENRRAKYIACIVGKNTHRAAQQVPKWMTTLEVNMPDKRSGMNLR